MTISKRVNKKFVFSKKFSQHRGVLNDLNWAIQIPHLDLVKELVSLMKNAVFKEFWF